MPDRGWALNDESLQPSAHRDLYFGGPVGGNTFPFPIRTGRFPSYTVSRVALMVPFFRSNPTICTSVPVSDLPWRWHRKACPHSRTPAISFSRNRIADQRSGLSAFRTSRRQHRSEEHTS